MSTTSTRVYFDNIKRFEDRALFDREYQTMPLSRREKIDRLKSQSDKCLSLGAGVLLKEALQKEGIEDYDVLYTKKGKPYLPGHDDIKISLSHSHEMVMCVISDNNVGCDIELIKPINLNIAKRFFSEEEYNEIIESDNKEQAFCRLWTLKESFLKVTGEGLGLPLNSFKTISDEKYEFFEIDEIEGYKAAYCVEVNDGKEKK